MIAAVTSLTGWSAYRLGATVVSLLDTKIIDGSGRALPEPQWSAPPFAADPRTEQTAEEIEDSGSVSQLTSATEGPLPTAPRASSDDPDYDPATAFYRGSGGTYKTYCVRLCDGFYWPISFSTTSDQLEADESACRSACGSPARLFVHRIPGEGPATMISLDGLPYTALKSAFLFRTRYDAQCRCQPQPWQEAAKDRHKLFAAAEAAGRGDTAAVAEAMRLKEKVTENRRAETEALEKADKVANRELENLEETASVAPPPRVARQQRRPEPRQRSETIRVGALQQTDERPRKGFIAASGPGRPWQDRAFGDN
ncbi:MAG: DUF2865 domain-containing protein [Hyphomicrobiaceae bacterium]